MVSCFSYGRARDFNGQGQGEAALQTGLALQDIQGDASRREEISRRSQKEDRQEVGENLELLVAGAFGTKGA